ncbi:MAG: FAD-binding oxidoreductase [Actinomycetota bacterium]
MVNKADVVVIGGGVIGTSIACHLAKYGVDTLLIERRNLAAGTSGACDGFIFLQSKKPGFDLRLALESARLYENLADELSYDIEYRKCGGMILIETAEQLKVITELMDGQRRVGLDIELTTTPQELEPILSGHIIGATYSPLDAQVNPFKVVLGFAQGAKRKGARILNYTEVQAIRTRTVRGELRVDSVITERGEIKTNTVINAAGVYAPVIAKMVGLDLPIIPRRGQVLVTEPLPEFVTRLLVDAGYITLKLAPDHRETDDGLGLGFTLEQTTGGNLLIGSTREFVGYDRRTTYHGIKAITQNALRIAPALKEVNIIRSFAGLRPYTPDGLPILGEVQGLSGFIIAAGHEGNGIALAPITGKLIAELVVKGRPSISLDEFGLERF